MDAVEFIKQHIRVCKSHSCNDCPLYRKCAIDCGASLCDEDIIESVKIVEQWAVEHPQETRLSKLLRQYPKAKAECIKEYYSCPAYLGYSCPEWVDCKGCWDIPVDEEGTRMNRFIEVTVSGCKMLLNLECVMDVEEDFDGSCRINLRDDYIEPEESYEIVRDMIAKGENKHEKNNRS